MRAFSRSSYQALKTATRRQFARFGKQEVAAADLDAAQSTISDWASPARLDRFVPVDRVMDATRLTGSPDILSAVALECGYVLIALPPVEGDGVWVKNLGAMAKETSEAVTALANAIAQGGDVKPSEIVQFDILNQLDEAIEQLSVMRRECVRIRDEGEGAQNG